MSQPNFQTFIIKDKTLFNSLKSYAAQVDSDLFVYDVETNGKNEKKADLYGVGIAFNTNKAFYIPWRHPTGARFWSAADEAEIRQWIKDNASERKLIGHNIIYDVLVTENNLGFDMSQYIYADTILMKHMVDEEPPFALKEIAVEILGAWADKAQEKLKDEVIAAGGRWTKDEKDMYLASTDTLGEYCCWDVLLTLMLFNEFSKQLEKEDLVKLVNLDTDRIFVEKIQRFLNLFPSKSLYNLCIFSIILNRIFFEFFVFKRKDFKMKVFI